MRNQFVTYEIAAKMREIGYNEQDFGYYRLSYKEDTEPFTDVELEFFHERYDNHNFRLNLHKSAGGIAICTAPLWQQAFDYLRSEFQTQILEQPLKFSDELDKPKWAVKVEGHLLIVLNTREEAILKALTLLKPSNK